GPRRQPRRAQRRPAAGRQPGPRPHGPNIAESAVARAIHRDGPASRPRRCRDSSRRHRRRSDGRRLRHLRQWRAAHGRSPCDRLRSERHRDAGSRHDHARADLGVGGTASQPVPTGSITLGEGGVVFFGGNRYRLEGPNSIDFTNPAVLEPDLHVAATRRVSSSDGQVEITLELTGTPATLETTLTSDHPHLSQADLASLLVTGRKVEEAGSYTPGAEELLGFVSGELFGTAARAVGLDVIRVERGTPDVSFDAGLVATEADPGARLTFGKNIGARTEVVFS